MRFLFDVVHPAHVHFYRHMIDDLETRGHSSLVVGREKDVTTDLLKEFEIPYSPGGTSAGSSRIRQIRELFLRVSALVRVSRDFRPDVICTRNPAGVLAARLLSKTQSVFDSDDGRAAGAHFRLGAFFADVVTSPECLSDDLGPRHRKYPGYKALAYLHRRRFEPDPAVRDLLGVGRDPFAVVRFVSMTASHDRGEKGLSPADKALIVETLASHCRVFVSAEPGAPVPPDAVPLPTLSSRMHDVLAGASVYIGDSQTMAFEAALLGTPSYHISSWTKRLACLVDIEAKALMRSYAPAQSREFMIDLQDALADLSVAKRAQRARTTVFESSTYDVTAWYVDLLEELGAG